MIQRWLITSEEGLAVLQVAQIVQQPVSIRPSSMYMSLQQLSTGCADRIKEYACDVGMQDLESAASCEQRILSQCFFNRFRFSPSGKFKVICLSEVAPTPSLQAMKNQTNCRSAKFRGKVIITLRIQSVKDQAYRLRKATEKMTHQAFLCKPRKPGEARPRLNRQSMSLVRQGYVAFDLIAACAGHRGRRLFASMRMAIRLHQWAWHRLKRAECFRVS